QPKSRRSRTSRRSGRPRTAASPHSPAVELRVITLNVNGVRSAAKKGLFRWLATQQPDVVCLQELKCHETDLDAKLHGLKLYQSCHSFADKKGYSGVDQYTWWSNRGQAWAKNVGWRIDYQIATPAIAARAVRESIYKRRRFSDHAPLTIDYDHAL